MAAPTVAVITRIERSIVLRSREHLVNYKAILLGYQMKCVEKENISDDARKERSADAFNTILLWVVQLSAKIRLVIEIEMWTLWLHPLKLVPSQALDDSFHTHTKPLASPVIG